MAEAHSILPAPVGPIGRKFPACFLSADQEIDSEADGGEYDDTQHRLLMPAHACLSLADREGAHY